MVNKKEELTDDLGDVMWGWSAQGRGRRVVDLLRAFYFSLLLDKATEGKDAPLDFKSM